MPTDMLRTQTRAIQLRQYGIAGQYHASDPRALLGGLGGLLFRMGGDAHVRCRQVGKRNPDPAEVRQMLALYGYRSKSMSIRAARDLARRLGAVQIDWTATATIGIDLEDKTIYLRGYGGHDWALGQLLPDIMRQRWGFASPLRQWAVGSRDG